jgi:hypothetical protein
MARIFFFVSLRRKFHKAVTFLHNIYEIFISNLDRDTGYFAHLFDIFLSNSIAILGYHLH